MKINSSFEKITSLGIDATQTKLGNSALASATPRNADTHVKLSTLADSVDFKLANEGGFDAEKVRQIKAAIAEGRFQIDSSRVGDGLVATVRDLIQVQPLLS